MLISVQHVVMDLIFFQEINDLKNHFKNQDDWCHTMCYTLLHSRMDACADKVNFLVLFLDDTRVGTLLRQSEP